jgi:hypothetical protein
MVELAEQDRGMKERSTPVTHLIIVLFAQFLGPMYGTLIAEN